MTYSWIELGSNRMQLFSSFQFSSLLWDILDMVLWDQGIPPQNLNIIFNSLILSWLQYAGVVTYLLTLLAWSILSWSEPLSTVILTLEALSNDADECLFRKIHNEHHCIHDLLPPLRPSINYLRPKGHSFELPRCALELHKKSFLPRCSFKYV